MTSGYHPDEIPTPVLTEVQSLLIQTSVTTDGGLTRWIQPRDDQWAEVADLVHLGLVWSFGPPGTGVRELTDDGLVVYARITRNIPLNRLERYDHGVGPEE